METLPEKESLLNKIQKMLRKADKNRNDSIDEANTAMLMVHKLLKKHGLSMADVMTEEEAKEGDSSIDIQEVEGAVFKCSKVPKWMTIVISVVNQMTETKTIIRSFVPEGKTYGTIKIIFIGFETDVAVANELFQYIRTAITKLSSKHQRESDGKFQQWRSFSEGCACKLMQRTLQVDHKWTPQSENNPLDVDNYEFEDDDEFNECDIENFVNDAEGDFGEDDDYGYGEDAHKKYEIMLRGKQEKIDEYIDQMEVEAESLSTSANIDHTSFEKGSVAGDGISLRTHKMINKD